MALPRPDRESTALVTGASAGIGAEFARELAARGYGLTLVARRAERLEALAIELVDRHGVAVECLPADLTDPPQREALVDEVKARSGRVAVLVNNAGFAHYGPFAGSEPHRDLEQVRVLVEAVVDLSARFLPAMVAARRGAIVNVASSAGFLPPPGWSVYGPAKAFVIAHSETLAAELDGSGVTVTAVCPGPVETEFVEPPFVQRLPRFLWCPPGRVAADGLAAVEAGKTRVVPGSPLVRASFGPRPLIPRRVLKAIARARFAEELQRPRPPAREGELERP